MMTMKHLTRLALPALLALPGIAGAHPGQPVAGGFLNGLVHPLSGLDHLSVMLAVGVWAVLVARGQAGRAVALFIGFMALGAVLGLQGLALPGIETGIAASVLVMGLLLMALGRVPVPAGMALIAAFAVFHGNAHGLEMPLGSGPATYAAGFLLASVLILLAGAVTAVVADLLRAQWLLRGAGLVAGGAGAWLLLGA